MNNRTKLKGAFLQALSLGIGVVITLLAAGGLQASTLWSNGSLNSTANGLGQNRCDSGPNVCNSGATASWMVFDNFNVPSGPTGWLVSGIDFTDFLINVKTADYLSSTWSIWAGDPLNGGTLVQTGSGKATISGCTPSLGVYNGACVFTVNLSTSVFLAGGATYYLGAGNVITKSGPNEESDRAYANGNPQNTLAQWEQTNGSIVGSSWSPGTFNYTFPGTPPGSITLQNPLGLTESATAFDILGAPSPEPGTLALMGIALAGLCWFRRRTA